MSNYEPRSLTRAILRTVCYYDIFDYPLTAEEIRRWLHPAPGEPVTATVDDVKTALAELISQGRLQKVEEFYVLPSRDGLAGIRAMRLDIGKRKWQIANSTARFLEIVPFVRMVAVTNTLAYDNARDQSDVDLLIITAPGHIWLARFAVTIIVAMLGYRRHGNKIRNRVCLSFYATTNGMDFSSLRLKPDDPHLTFWTAQIVPLIDFDTYEKYKDANKWVNDSLPFAWDWDWKKKLNPPNLGLRSINKMYGAFFETSIGKWMEMWLRDRQLSKMDKNLHSKSKDGGTDVVITEDVLKFHEADRRAEYNQRFIERCRQLGI
jgi:hypothetical protein